MTHVNLTEQLAGAQRCSMLSSTLPFYSEGSHVGRLEGISGVYLPVHAG